MIKLFLNLLALFHLTPFDNATLAQLPCQQTIESSPCGENCEGEAVTLSQLVGISILKVLCLVDYFDCKLHLFVAYLFDHFIWNITK